MSDRHHVERIQGNPFRIRDPQASALTEIWLVSAVATILLIRGYLHLTGYPQVGGDTLHIAHMLWGGLGMVIGFGMLALFAHRVWKPVAAVVGGAGFGGFIDELGKFITKDNDYFYQPAVAVIYAVFVVLFLTARTVTVRRAVTAADHLYLAVAGAQWAALGKLDDRQYRLAIGHLDASGVDSPFTRQLRQMLDSVDREWAGEPSRIIALRDRLSARYWSIVSNRWLYRIAIGLVMLKGIELVATLAIGTATDRLDYLDGLSVEELGLAISGVASGILAVAGTILLVRSDRLAGLRLFSVSILVSLLVGQVFAFAAEQFFALGGALVDVALLGAVRFAITAETERTHGTTWEYRGKADLPDVDLLPS